MISFAKGKTAPVTVDAFDGTPLSKAAGPTVLELNDSMQGRAANAFATYRLSLRGALLEPKSCVAAC
eukprot:2040942-Amphidinium_carterae.1